MPDPVSILGVKVSAVDFEGAAGKAMEFLNSDEPKIIVTPNSEMILAASRDEEFCRVLNSADMVVPDGIGVVYAAKLVGRPLSERVAGFDLVCELLSRIAGTEHTVYFLGAKPTVAEKAAEKCRECYPGIRIVGTHDGYFKNDDEVIAEINALSPALLVVCLGFPRQEKWMIKNRERLNIKLAIGAGGTLDVLAGNSTRAPEFYQKHGIEWLYRLKKEPSRIIRMTALPRFALKVIFKGRKYK
ncbi:MAG: WecB/TagA/CpsF family glycosyltransferase [Clostridia bacterium]|nr:WecB/TagA/CpsF family glycosyltransferase [Clostridia bacterium]